MTEMTVLQEDFATRCQKILGVARQLYQGTPDWVTFFREVLGVGGAARSVFTTQSEFISFEKCGEFNEIQVMVNNLRNRKASASSINEPTRVITVRLPESLHEALKLEATDHNTSMNKLCIGKLLQVLTESTKGNSVTMNRAAMPSPMQQHASTNQPSFRSTYSNQPAPNSGSMNGR
jgi:predicted HicB family RNase H-like nuclease